MWIADRFLRITRILLLNPKFWKQSGTVSYNRDSNIIRLAVDNKRASLQPYPGSYYYIYTLNHLLFWESHPFTLAYPTSESSHVSRLSSKRSEEADIDHDGNHSSLSSESDELLAAKNSTSSLVFLIRPYDGFTSRLKDYAANGPRPLRVLLEGPYGGVEHFHNFQNLLFVVGGSGIAVPLSYLKSLVRCDGSMASISVIWAVREPHFFADILNTDLSLALPKADKKISFSIYCTRESRSVQNEWSRCRATRGFEVHLSHGRPNIHEEIEKAAVDCRAVGEKLAVVACGPGGMSDDARAAVVKMMKKGYADIDFFDKGFTW